MDMHLDKDMVEYEGNQ
jgi:hypothetical protein